MNMCLRGISKGIILRPIEISQGGMKAFIKKRYPNVKIFWEDGRYWIISRKNFEKICKKDWPKQEEYIRDKWDCEDYAGYFKYRTRYRWGFNCVGQVLNYTGAHSFNLVKFKVGMYIFEPQSLRIIEPKELEKILEKYKGMQGKNNTWEGLDNKERESITRSALAVACCRTTRDDPLEVFIEELHQQFDLMGVPEATQNLYKVNGEYLII